MIVRSLAFIVVGIFLFGGYFIYKVPGWHRAVAPGVFDIPKLAPRIYSDAPERLEEFEEKIRKSIEVSSALFGQIEADPIYIICTKGPCLQTFDLAPSGLAIGFHRVLLGPKGTSQQIFNHERLHIDLHKRMNIQDVVTKRFPSWFDEGFAEYFSGPKRFRINITEDHKRSVLEAESASQWSSYVRVHSVRVAYMASRAVVEDIVRKVGKKGLIKIVNETQNLDDFYQRLPRTLDFGTG